VTISTIKTRWLFISFLLLLLGSSCTPSKVKAPQKSDTNKSVTFVTNTPQQTETLVPTSTESPTTSPTLTPTPKLIYPVTYGTPFPTPSTVINQANVDKLRQLAVLGQGFFNNIVWSPDGHYLAVTSPVGAYLYDAVYMNLILTIPFQDQADSYGMPNSPGVNFSSDSQYFAVASSEGIYIYDLPKLNQKLYIQPDVRASNIEFFPDNSSLAACLENGTVDLYSIGGQKLIESIGSNEKNMGKCNLLVSGDGHTLAWWLWTSSTLHTWNLADNTPGKDFDLGYIFEAALSQDGSILAVSLPNTSGFSEDTKFFDTKTGSIISILPNHIIESFSKSSDLLATSLDVTKPFTQRCTGQIYIWRLSDHKSIRVLFGSDGYSNIAFNADGTQIAAGFSGYGCPFFSKQIQQSYIKVWNIGTGGIVGEHVAALSSTKFLTIHTEFGIIDAENLVFSADNRIAGIGSGYLGELQQIYLWDKFGEAPVQPIRRAGLGTNTLSLNGLEVDLGKVNLGDEPFSYPAIVSPDSNYEFAQGANYTYELKNENGGGVIHNFGNGAIGTFSPNSDLAVVFVVDHTYGDTAWIEIWDLKTQKRLRSMVFTAEYPRYLQFSPDGRLLVTISTDQMVHIWGVNE